MRIAVISDIHGNTEVYRPVLLDMNDSQVSAGNTLAGVFS